MQCILWHPQSWKTFTISDAIKDVSSAGLAITVFPVSKAADTWLTKIAIGKFHGLIHKKVPFGACLR